MKWYRAIMIAMWWIMFGAFFFYWTTLFASYFLSRTIEGINSSIFMMFYFVNSIGMPFYALATAFTLSKEPKKFLQWIMLFAYILEALWLYHYSAHPDHFSFWGSVID